MNHLSVVVLFIIILEHSLEICNCVNTLVMCQAGIRYQIISRDHVTKQLSCGLTAQVTVTLGIYVTAISKETV